MKRKLYLLTFLFALAYSNGRAQCSISGSNTTNGFTPNTLPCIMQNTTYGQAVQVHVPSSASYNGLSLTVDSVQLLSITGLPSGITPSGTPANGVIQGGGNGCLWYSGTTNDAAGTYALTFNVRLWLSYSGISSGPVDTTLNGLGYNYSLDVCAAPQACTIDGSNTTDGFTPTSVPTISQNVAYGQAVQVHVPATGNFNGINLTVDSVQLTSVDGLPLGINVTGSPLSGIIHGGGNGCLWYSGTTSAPSGAYPLTFNIRLWLSYLGNSAPEVDTTMAGLGYNFSLNVAGTVTSVANLGDNNTVTLYPNPAQNQLNLQFTAEPNAELAITDLSGKVLSRITATNLLTTVDINTLAAGTYILNVTDKLNKSTQSLKFSKF